MFGVVNWVFLWHYVLCNTVRPIMMPMVACLGRILCANLGKVCSNISFRSLNGSFMVPSKMVYEQTRNHRHVSVRIGKQYLESPCISFEINGMPNATTLRARNAFLARWCTSEKCVGGGGPNKCSAVLKVC